MANPRNPFIMNTKRDEADSILVGGHVPRPFADRLSLYALYKSTAKSTIIAEILKSIEIPDREVMIRELARRATREWIRRKEEGTTQTFEEYLDEVRERLRRRKIHYSDRDAIVKQIGAMK